MSHHGFLPGLAPPIGADSVLQPVYMTLQFCYRDEQYATVISFGASEQQALTVFQQELSQRGITFSYCGPDKQEAERLRGEEGVGTLEGLVDRLPDVQVERLLKGVLFDILMEKE